MITLLTTTFIIGLLGSLHCIGMCGGLVSAMTLSRPTMWWPGLISYQIGRIISYTLLGALFATLGISLHNSGWLGEGQQALMYVAGIVMILFALNLGGWMPDPLAKFTGSIMKVTGLAHWTKKASSDNSLGPWFSVGILNGFLPCGLVYAALAISLTADTILNGALMMLAFGVGTLPAMIATPFLIRSFTPELRGKLLKVAAIALIVLALLTMFRQQLHGDHASHANHSATPAIETEQGHNHVDHSSHTMTTPPTQTDTHQNHVMDMDMNMDAQTMSEESPPVDHQHHH